MKAQAKAAIASVVVIALALTAVSGVTYSWWTDSESTEIGITTGRFSLGDGGYSLSYFDGDADKDVDLKSSSGSGSDPASKTTRLSFEVDPPNNETDGKRVYTLTYTTRYTSSAPVTIKVEATIIGGDGWIGDVKATDLRSGSTNVTGTANSISAHLDPSSTDKEITAVIQFTVDADLAFGQDPATLKIDAQLISRAA